MSSCKCLISLPGVESIKATSILKRLIKSYGSESAKGTSYMDFERIHPTPAAIQQQRDTGQFDHLARRWRRNSEVGWGTNARGLGPELRRAGGSEPSLFLHLPELRRGPEPSLFLDCKWSPCVGIVRVLSQTYSEEPWLIEWFEELTLGPPGSGFFGYALYRGGNRVVKVKADHQTPLAAARQL